jgi:hypothetical protein
MKPIIFKSEKAVWIGLIIWGAVILILAAIIYNFIDAHSLIEIILVFILLSLSAGFLLWIWFDTKYKIEDGFLYCNSGPINAKIEINKITQIIKNRTLWYGLRPALAHNGLVIMYNKWDEIYISPKDKDGFIEEVLNINAEIKVKEEK